MSQNPTFKISMFLIKVREPWFALEHDTTVGYGVSESLVSRMSACELVPFVRHSKECRTFP